MPSETQDEPATRGFAPRRPLTQQSSLGDLGPDVAPIPPREIPKRNKWARR